MTKEIPRKENYGVPFLNRDFRCYNCNQFTSGIREIGERRFAYKFWWLCPECFKKLILKNIEKEKVIFT